MTSRRNLSADEVGLLHGHRSGLEDKACLQLQQAGHPVIYEDFKIPYRVEKDCTYTPDLLLTNGVIVETKGRFVTADRQKHLLIKKQHPAADIRFVFSRSASRISKASRTTYAMWCEKNGFQYADKVIPAAWLREKTSLASLDFVRALYRDAGRPFPSETSHLEGPRMSLTEQAVYDLGEKVAQRDAALNPKQAAALLGCSDEALNHRRSRGNGPAYTKHGNAIFYAYSDVAGWAALKGITLKTATPEPALA